MEERVSKILSNRGVCSRRKAEELISLGYVSIEGRVVNIGDKAPIRAEIILSSEAKDILKNSITIILNKPLGYISHLPQDGQKEAKELLVPARCVHDQELELPIDTLSAVGRLDINSSGLLLFTNDGTIAKKIIGEDTQIEKEYLVRFEGFVTGEILRKLEYGLSLDGKKLKRAKVSQLDHDLLRIILKEGKKRQVRRMCEKVGLEVLKLKRVRIGNITLGNLPTGCWKVLDRDFLI